MDKEAKVALEDWPMPRYGDPVWVTVSEYDLSYLRRVCEKEGSLAAKHLLIWAMDSVIGRGVSTDWELAACHLMSQALSILSARSLDPVDLEPTFESDDEVGPVTLSDLLAHNVGCGQFSDEEIVAFCRAEVGDEITTGGGSFASTTFRRVI